MPCTHGREEFTSLTSLTSHSRAIQQLRACGVLETIRISASGYPSRWTYADFAARYRILVRTRGALEPRTVCEQILSHVVQEKVRMCG
jgi:myosin V